MRRPHSQVTLFSPDGAQWRFSCEAIGDADPDELLRTVAQLRRGEIAVHSTKAIAVQESMDIKQWSTLLPVAMRARSKWLRSNNRGGTGLYAAPTPLAASEKVEPPPPLAAAPPLEVRRPAPSNRMAALSAALGVRTRQLGAPVSALDELRRAIMGGSTRVNRYDFVQRVTAYVVRHADIKAPHNADASSLFAALDIDGLGRLDASELTPGLVPLFEELAPAAAADLIFESSVSPKRGAREAPVMTAMGKSTTLRRPVRLEPEAPPLAHRDRLERSLRAFAASGSMLQPPAHAAVAAATRTLHHRASSPPPLPVTARQVGAAMAGDLVASVGPAAAIGITSEQFRSWFADGVGAGPYPANNFALYAGGPRTSAPAVAPHESPPSAAATAATTARRAAGHASVHVDRRGNVTVSPFPDAPPAPASIPLPAPTRMVVKGPPPDALRFRFALDADRYVRTHLRVGEPPKVAASEAPEAESKASGAAAPLVAAPERAVHASRHGSIAISGGSGGSLFARGGRAAEHPVERDAPTAALSPPALIAARVHVNRHGSISIAPARGVFDVERAGSAAVPSPPPSRPPPETPPAALPAAIHDGELSVKGLILKRWTAKYFVLRADGALYDASAAAGAAPAKDERVHAVLDAIVRVDAEMSTDEATGEDVFVFAVADDLNGGRTRQLRASSRAEWQRWIEGMRRAGWPVHVAESAAEPETDLEPTPRGASTRQVHVNRHGSVAITNVVTDTRLVSIPRLPEPALPAAALPAAAAAAADETICAGVLSSKSAILKRWTSKRFALRVDGSMYDASDGSGSGRVHAVGHTIVGVDAAVSVDEATGVTVFSFAIADSLNGGRTQELRASSRAEWQHWVEGFRRAGWIVRVDASALAAPAAAAPLATPARTVHVNRHGSIAISHAQASAAPSSAAAVDEDDAARRGAEAEAAVAQLRRVHAQDVADAEDQRRAHALAMKEFAASSTQRGARKAAASAAAAVADERRRHEVRHQVALAKIERDAERRVAKAEQAATAQLAALAARNDAAAAAAAAAAARALVELRAAHASEVSSVSRACMSAAQHEMDERESAAAEEALASVCRSLDEEPERSKAELAAEEDRGLPPAGPWSLDKGQRDAESARTRAIPAFEARQNALAAELAQAQREGAAAAAAGAAALDELRAVHEREIAETLSAHHAAVAEQRDADASSAIARQNALAAELAAAHSELALSNEHRVRVQHEMDDIKAALSAAEQGRDADVQQAEAAAAAEVTALKGALASAEEEHAAGLETAAAAAAAANAELGAELSTAEGKWSTDLEQVAAAAAQSAAAASAALGAAQRESEAAQASHAAETDAARSEACAAARATHATQLEHLATTAAEHVRATRATLSDAEDALAAHNARHAEHAARVSGDTATARARDMQLAAAAGAAAQRVVSEDNLAAALRRQRAGFETARAISAAMRRRATAVLWDEAQREIAAAHREALLAAAAEQRQQTRGSSQADVRTAELERELAASVATAAAAENTAEVKLAAMRRAHNAAEEELASSQNVSASETELARVLHFFCLLTFLHFFCLLYSFVDSSRSRSLFAAGGGAPRRVRRRGCARSATHGGARRVRAALRDRVRGRADRKRSRVGAAARALRRRARRGSGAARRGRRRSEQAAFEHARGAAGGACD